MLGPDGREGIEALTELELANTPLPVTVRSRSGGGGRHYLFRWPSDGPALKNRKNHLGLPIDVRGTGGYFVAPPSRTDKGEYAWEVTPAETPLAEAPPWLLEWVRQDGKGGSKGFIGKASSGSRPDAWERARLYVAECPPAISGQGGHDRTLTVARAVVWGFDLGAEAGYDLLQSEYNPRCVPPWSDAELRHKCQEADTVPFGKPRGYLLNEDRNPERNGKMPEGRAKEAFDDPHRLARSYRERHQIKGEQTLRYWREEFLRWDGRSYAAVQDKEIRAELTQHIKREFDRVAIQQQNQARKAGNGENGKVPQRLAKKVTAGIVSNVLQALTGEALLSGKTEPPAWLDGTTLFPPGEVLACANGLLHLPSLTENLPGFLVPPTPKFFSLNALDYDFAIDTPRPVQWLAFLDAVWGDDHEAITALQEWFGYCLLPDTSQQKILLLVGPKRSGKGTIGRILARVIGEANVCAPTLSSLGEPFGLWPLLGKTLALIADARLSGRSDTAVVVERLLSISGEDGQTVNRKNRSQVITRLPVRFMIMTNELPRIADASGALVSRMILLRLTRSWLGSEDTGLTNKLLKELPGILLWAIEGWRRLRQRGRFLQPSSSQNIIQEMEDLASPIGAFIRECCVVKPGLRVPIEDLFRAWLSWGREQGYKDPGNRQKFGRDIRAVLPHLGVEQPREDDKRVRVYVGLDLQPHAKRKASEEEVD
jgi:putative DNA primase/helicase